jgi:hypothetical protein
MTASYQQRIVTYKVVRRSGEALNRSLSVSHSLCPSLLALLVRPPCIPPHRRERPEEHDHKVQEHGYDDAEDRTDIGEDVPRLLCEDDDDGVEQTEEGDGAEVGEELCFEEVAAECPEEEEAGSQA